MKKTEFNTLIKRKESETEKLEEINEIPTQINESKSPYVLVVRSPFGKYKKGDQIHESAQINAIIGTHQESMVLKTLRKAG
jgi:hypothetical protein